MNRPGTDRRSQHGPGVGDRDRPISESDVLTVITEFLAVRDVPREAIIDSATFTGDLGVDSLELMTLALELEDEYGVRVTAEDAAHIHTVGDAVAHVVGKAQRTPTFASAGPSERG